MQSALELLYKKDYLAAFGQAKLLEESLDPNLVYHFVNPYPDNFGGAYRSLTEVEWGEDGAELESLIWVRAAYTLKESELPSLGATFTDLMYLTDSN